MSDERKKNREQEIMNLEKTAQEFQMKKFGPEGDITRMQNQKLQPVLEKVQNAIINLTKNKTTLVIAHRLSTIIRADKIIIIDQGELIESGTHNELLKNSSIYKNLYSKQLSAN